MDPRPHFFDLTPDDLHELVQSWGMPRYRAEQLLRWVYQRGVTDPQAMTDLSLADRRTIADRIVFTRGRVIEHQTASDETQKLLIHWGGEAADNGLNVLDDRLATECVLIPAESKQSGAERRTACISSQIGCAVGCRFCASGIGGLDGNLTAGQIVEQIHWLNRLPGNEGVTHIVFMGMGEPLSNFENVTKAIRTLTAQWAYHISARKITLSTVGLPAQMRRLAERDLPPFTLAISLHAPNDELRRQLIPWAQYTTIDSILEAADEYFRKTGREITLEYILLAGVNDGPKEAAELARVAKRLRCNVNLIRYNEVAGLPFRRPETENVLMFQHALRTAGVNVHIRASRGRDIAAACGQLRHEQAARSG